MSAPSNARPTGAWLTLKAVVKLASYQLQNRYQECGIHGLTDRSRRPYRYANQLRFQVENYILNVKHEHPSWGARKIRERLLRSWEVRS
jgi:hypothetical protein